MPSSRQIRTDPVDQTARRAEEIRLGLMLRDQPERRQEAWQGLQGALEERIRSRLAANGSFRAARLDDIVAEVLSHYWEKAVAGTLLAGWDPERASPVPMLTGRALPHIARKASFDVAAREDGVLQLEDLDNLDAGSGGGIGGVGEGGGGGDADGASPDPDPGAEAVIAGGLSFADLPEDGPEKVHLVGGCQLFERIRWDDGPGPAVQERMPAYLAPVAERWRAALTERLRARRRELAERYRKAVAEVSELKGSERLRELARCGQRRDRSHFDLHFRPLDGHALVELTGQKLNACQQQLSRYRRDLPAMFVELLAYRRRHAEGEA